MFYVLFLGAYKAYESASTEERRHLLLDSFEKSYISVEHTYCEKSCGDLFTNGKVCVGAMGASGARRLGDGEAKSTGGSGTNDAATLWPNFNTADPDMIAVHLWSYSMGGRKKGATPVPNDAALAFYKRVNVALLEDDPTMLGKMANIMCGIIHWIRKNRFVATEEIILYRGN